MTMHVVMIPSWYPEDARDFNGSFFPEQAEALMTEGHRVGVLAVRGTPLYQPRVLASRPRGVRSSSERGIEVLRRDIAVPLPWLHSVNQKVWNSAWSDLLQRYIERHGRPDVLHAHAMFPGGIAAHAMSERFGIPFLVTEHRPSSIERLSEPGMRALAESAARASGSLIAVARGFVPDLNEAYGLEGDRGWRYLPGLLSPQFENLVPRPIPAPPFTVGHVSHQDPGKRVPMLIGAFADAFSRGDERLRIAGDSPHRVHLEQVARDEGVADRVDFVGAVSREHIADEFARYHVFVLPSVAEAFGTVLWEAMASGVPLLATETWAGRNAITDENGITVPIDDREALAEGLRALRSTAQRFDPAAVRQLAIDHCGRRVFVDNYVRAYRETIRG